MTYRTRSELEYANKELRAELKKRNSRAAHLESALRNLGKWFDHMNKQGYSFEDQRGGIADALAGENGSSDFIRAEAVKEMFRKELEHHYHPDDIAFALKRIMNNFAKLEML